MKIVEAVGMSMEDILKSERIVLSSGHDFVRSPYGPGWQLCGMGIVGGMLKEFSYYEVRELITAARKVLVVRKVDSGIAYLAKDES